MDIVLEHTNEIKYEYNNNNNNNIWGRFSTGVASY